MRHSLHAYVREAWHVVEPGAKFIDGLPVEAICHHLQAVTEGKIRRLLVNVPPGTMKSLLCNVFWPSWEWGPRRMPHLRTVGASHEETLAIRDNIRMRRLVMSEWYQSRWPIELTKDVNGSQKFENVHTGFRQAKAILSITGVRGDRVVIDDPHSVKGGDSDKTRNTVVRDFRESVPTRLNVPSESAIIVIMQRVHEADVSGMIISELKDDYCHLMLPMRFEPERACTTSIGWSDPRTIEGELLFPERFTPESVDETERILGPYATAGQMQQRPAPRTGGFFAWEQIQIVPKAIGVKQWVRYWDKAGTGVKMGFGSDGNIYVAHCEAGQWGAPNREATMKQTAHLDGPECVIYIEEEGGSGGKESAQATIKNLRGFVCYADRPTGDKVVRADPWSSQIAAGVVRLVAGDWNNAYLDEHKTFPNGKYKDRVDASSGAFNMLNGNNEAGVF